MNDCKSFILFFGIVSTLLWSCVEYFFSKNFFPNKVWGEILFWQKGKFLSNYSKNIETQNEWVSVFYVLEQMQFENSAKLKRIVYYR